MTDVKKKRKSPILIFVLVFGFVILMMFISNWRPSVEAELAVPHNGGAAALSTLDGSLACFFMDGRLCLWDWKDFSKGFREYSIESDTSILLSSDRVLYARKNPLMLIIRNLAGGSNRQIPFSSDYSHVYFRTGRGQRPIIVLGEKKDTVAPGSTDYDIMELDTDAEIVRLISKVKTKADELLSDWAVADEKPFIVCSGRRNNAGLIVLVDMDRRDILWQKEYAETGEFTGIAIAPAGDVLYAGSKEGFVYKIDIISGSVLGRLTALEKGEKRAVTNDVSACNLKVSNDGRLVAATINPIVYVWDSQSGQLSWKKVPGHKITSKVVFSPDSRFLATSDLRASGTIRVWKLAEN